MIVVVKHYYFNDDNYKMKEIVRTNTEKVNEIDF